MVSDGKTLLVCGTNPMPLVTRWSARQLVMSSPLRVTVPELIFTRPNSALSSVDLPAPLGPMMPTSSFSWQYRSAAVEDVDAGQVAGDQVVRAQDGALGGCEVRAALGRWPTSAARVVPGLGLDGASPAPSVLGAQPRCSPSGAARSAWWRPLLVDLGLCLGEDLLLHLRRSGPGRGASRGRRR